MQLFIFGSITCLFFLLFVKPQVKSRWQCSCLLNSFAYKYNRRTSWYIYGSLALAAARKDSTALSVAIVTGDLSWLLRWTLSFLHKKHLSLNNFGTLEFIKKVEDKRDEHRHCVSSSFFLSAKILVKIL